MSKAEIILLLFTYTVQNESRPEMNVRMNVWDRKCSIVWRKDEDRVRMDPRMCDVFVDLWTRGRTVSGWREVERD